MKKIIAFVALAIPSLAFAQALPAITNVNQLTNRALSIGDTFTYILVALAVIFIVWNVVIYIINPAGSESRAEAGKAILWGIVGLFIIVSIWGLVNILTNSFKTQPGRQPIPNSGNTPIYGGLPANQVPQVE